MARLGCVSYNSILDRIAFLDAVTPWRRLSQSIVDEGAQVTLFARTQATSYSPKKVIAIFEI
jgi:hypothetical protein